LERTDFWSQQEETLCFLKFLETSLFAGVRTIGLGENKPINQGVQEAYKYKLCKNKKGCNIP
jgi:hypothetical protein